MGDTSISWTDKTWNFLRGCSRVSAGCMNCYAERIATRFGGEGMPYEGLVTIRSKHPQTGRPTTGVRGKWTGKVRFLPEVLSKPLRWKKPQKIFVNSMSDLFHEEVTFQQIASAFGVMAACPQHTFQILTKRPKRALEFYAWILREAAVANDNRGMTPAARCFIEAQRATLDVGDGRLARHPLVENALKATWPLPNVWVGVSVENQEAADERIPLLLEVLAAVRFLSCEPLLGPIDLDMPRCEGAHCGPGEWGVAGDGATPWCSEHEQELGYGHWLNADGGIDWVIAGCESGPGRRDCDVTWLRSLRHQCAESGVPFFLKQAAEEWQLEVGPEDNDEIEVVAEGPGSTRKGNGKIIELPYLDGVQHAAFPEAA